MSQPQNISQLLAAFKALSEQLEQAVRPALAEPAAIPEEAAMSPAQEEPEMIEMTDAKEAEAPAEAPETKVAEAFKYQVNDEVLCVDTQGKSYVSVILDRRHYQGRNEVLIHYKEWSEKWDEWIPENSTRIREVPAVVKEAEKVLNAPPAAAPAPVAVPLTVTEALINAMDNNKDYLLAANYIMAKVKVQPESRQEIFNFFAGRWWRDLSNYDKVEPEDPKAPVWEALVRTGVVRWQDLWATRASSPAHSANTLGLILFFRGMPATRQHMADEMKRDPRLKTFIQDFKYDGTSLFVMACRSCLDKVLPFITAFAPPSFITWTEGINEALDRRGEISQERLEATIHVLADHLPK